MGKFLIRFLAKRDISKSQSSNRQCLNYFPWTREIRFGAWEGGRGREGEGQKEEATRLSRDGNFN